jgi:hypothetical protein
MQQKHTKLSSRNSKGEKMEVMKGNKWGGSVWEKENNPTRKKKTRRFLFFCGLWFLLLPLRIGRLFRLTFTSSHSLNDAPYSPSLFPLRRSAFY